MTKTEEIMSSEDGNMDGNVAIMIIIVYFIFYPVAFRKHDLTPEIPMPHFGFSKALSGFLMMMTQNGKLLYISDNAAEYLGHSMEDLLIHGDSVYDIIEKQDHQAIQAELMRSPNPLSIAPDNRIFLCRMNVSRNARRQMRFGDQKVVLVQGHYVSFLPLCSRNEPVFLATCTPVAMPETRECVVQGSTNVFTTIHSMDMKFLHLDRNGEFHLGYTKSGINGLSWYDLVHWDNLKDATSKHRLITQSEQERSCILLLRMQTNTHNWIWIHAVLQVKDSSDSSQQPVIVCTNQILSEKEAAVMKANSWLYQFYSLHSKMHYGLAYEPHANRLPTYYPNASAPTVLAHPYHPTAASAVPESAAVPLHSMPYHHIHPAVAPINGSPGHPLHPHHPTPVLQYSPQAGSIPYPGLIQATASPISAETEPNRQPASQPQLPLKRPHSPRNSSIQQIQQHQQQAQHPEESESPEPNKRPNPGHHLPPPPPSAYHHPRANPFGYPASMFGPGGFTSMSSVTELGSVVPVSGYYGGHQMLASVPYHHPSQIGNHFRAQNKLSLLEHDADGDLEQSLTPTNTEDVSNMISMASSSSTYFKYPPAGIHMHHHQYYHPFTGQPFDKELDKFVSKSPHSSTSDYGSGTSSPPSAFEKPKKDGSLNHLEGTEPSLASITYNPQQQAYQTLKSWNNHPVYADLSTSKPSKIVNSFYQLKVRDFDVSELNSQKYGIPSYPSPSQSIILNDSNLMYHQHHPHHNDFQSATFMVGPSSDQNPRSNVHNQQPLVSQHLQQGLSENPANETPSPCTSPSSIQSGGRTSRASRPVPSSRQGELHASTCGVGRASGYDGVANQRSSGGSQERTDVKS